MNSITLYREDFKSSTCFDYILEALGYKEESIDLIDEIDIFVESSTPVNTIKNK